VEERSTSVAKQLGQQQGLIAMNASTPKSKIGEKKMAVRATAEADEALAAS
jgi:hypothetical protein